MPKKTTNSDTSASAAPVQERRRAPRAPKGAAAATPAAPVAEPDGSPALVRDTADEIQRVDIGSTTPDAPTYEEIAEAAYQRYLARGGQHGHDFEDWLDAERTLRERR